MAGKRLTAAEKAALEAEKAAKEVEVTTGAETPEVKEEVKKEEVTEAPKAPEKTPEEAPKAPEKAAEETPKTDEEVKVEDVDGDVVAEFTQQLSIFGQLIYNAQEEDSTIIVENLGYGDIYVSDKPNIRVGNEEQRLLFKEQKAFKAKKLFLTSASQPVASIIEIK